MKEEGRGKIRLREVGKKPHAKFTNHTDAQVEAKITWLLTLVAVSTATTAAAALSRGGAVTRQMPFANIIKI